MSAMGYHVSDFMPIYAIYKHYRHKSDACEASRKYPGVDGWNRRKPD